MTEKKSFFGEILEKVSGFQFPGRDRLTELFFSDEQSDLRQDSLGKKKAPEFFTNEKKLDELQNQLEGLVDSWDEETLPNARAINQVFDILVKMNLYAGHVNKDFELQVMDLKNILSKVRMGFKESDRNKYASLVIRLRNIAQAPLRS